MRNVISAFCFVVVLTSCVADSAMKIHGVAPTEGDCEVQLVKSSTGEVVVKQAVSSEFEETLIWGAWSGDLDLVGVCDGVVTKTFNEWRMPRNFSEAYELGDISP